MFSLYDLQELFNEQYNYQHYHSSTILKKFKPIQTWTLSEVSKSIYNHCSPRSNHIGETSETNHIGIPHTDINKPYQKRRREAITCDTAQHNDHIWTDISGNVRKFVDNHHLSRSRSHATVMKDDQDYYYDRNGLNKHHTHGINDKLNGKHVNKLNKRHKLLRKQKSLDSVFDTHRVRDRLRHIHSKDSKHHVLHRFREPRNCATDEYNKHLFIEMSLFSETHENLICVLNEHHF